MFIWYFFNVNQNDNVVFIPIPKTLINIYCIMYNIHSFAQEFEMEWAMM